MRYDDSFIAQRKLFALAADGSCFNIDLGIGKPYQISADEWACAVQVVGLHDHLHDVHGVDSWQALQLACQLAAQMLGHFTEDGGTVFWEKGGERLELPDLFAKVPGF
jgi:hypothetical protein